MRPCPPSSCLDEGERIPAVFEEEELMSAGMGRVVTTWVTTLEKNVSSVYHEELVDLNFMPATEQHLQNPGSSPAV